MDGLFYIKAPVFPWRKFAGVDGLLGPEMRSTGEVMGVCLPKQGGVFLSIRDEMGFELHATHGTAKYLSDRGIRCAPVFKVREGRPDAVDLLENGRIQLILNTPLGKKAVYDERTMRRAALGYGIACITNLSAAKAAVSAIRSLRAGELKVVRMQDRS